MSLSLSLEFYSNVLRHESIDSLIKSSQIMNKLVIGVLQRVFSIRMFVFEWNIFLLSKMNWAKNYM